MLDLEFLFHPQSIAIVGTPRDLSNIAGGAGFLAALIAFGYEGRVYPINPNATEIMGLKSYPDLMSLPETPDYVIACIPATLTPGLIRECGARGVKAVGLYTAGFSEAGEEGEKLEQALAGIAREVGVRLIGPNCMGIYCPATGVSYQRGQSKEPGPVALLCQSGGNSNILALMGRDRGIRFSKIISYGNAVDLNETDFIEYLTGDADTAVIGAYIEGVKGGPRFLPALATAADSKPVIVLKGGLTDAGTRAIASHTGSLATPREKWDSLCRQAGAMQVYNLDEMLDLIVTALYMRPAEGRRVGIVGWGGGASVLNAEACESAGLKVPAFSPGLRQQMVDFAYGPGASISNPVDSPVVTDTSLFSRTLGLIADSGEVDIILVQLPLATPHTVGDAGLWDRARETVLDVSKSLSTPLVAVQPSTAHPESSDVYNRFQHKCADIGLPVYATARDAALAVSRFTEYHALRRSRKTLR